MTIYMQFDDIEGDVTAKGHENWIALNDVDFNVKRQLSTDPGRIADREGSRPAISEITLTKKMDKSSPHLFSESCVGKAKSEVKIDICQTNDSLTPYAEVTLNNVIVSGYDVTTDNYTTHTDKDGKSTQVKEKYPLEKITLSFDKIELRYTPFDSQNNPQSPIPAGYDLKEAVAT
jgi:type VI secretion system secreted protein Hcp